MSKKMMSLLLVLAVAMGLFCVGASAAELEIPAAMTPAASPDPNNAIEVSEKENNDDFPEANVIYNNYVVTGNAVGNETEVDVFKFTLNKRSNVAVVSGAEKSSLVFMLVDSEYYVLGESYDEGYQEGGYYDSMGYVLDPGTYYLVFGDLNATISKYQYLFYIYWEDHTHVWDGGTITTQPTYTTTGIRTYTCTQCLDQKTETVPVVPHNHVYIDTVVEPTCVYGGYTSHKCSLCGASYADTYTSNLGHEWSDGACLTCGTAWEDQFEDVPKDEYYYTPVMWAVENSITAGSGHINTFKPNDPCTRAQVVTFLWRAAGEPEPATTENPFTDVPAGEWFHDAVLWAVEEGITVGIGNGKFGTEDPCTRAQVATFLYRAAGEPGHSVTENPFTDIVDQWSEAPILWAYENGITMGDNKPDTFNPNGECIRAQIVTFLYRAAQVEAPQEPEVTTVSGIFTDEENGIEVVFLADGTCNVTDVNGTCTTTYTIENGVCILIAHSGEEYAYEMNIAVEDVEQIVFETPEA